MLNSCKCMHVIYHQGWQAYHIAEGRGGGPIENEQSIKFYNLHSLFKKKSTIAFGEFSDKPRRAWWGNNTGSLKSCMQLSDLSKRGWWYTEKKKRLDTTQRGSTVRLQAPKLPGLLQRRHIAWNNNDPLIIISMTISFYSEQNQRKHVEATGYPMRILFCEISECHWCHISKVSIL